MTSGDDWGYEDYERDDLPSPAEVRETIRHAIEEGERQKREEAAEPSLEEFSVWWDDVTPQLVESFRECLDAATTERELQVFLEAHPTLLVQPLGGGHGRWVIPHKRLGSEFVPDFVVAQKSSIGFEWTAVELESPTATIFTASGEFGRTASHAMRQIEDWRVWLARNRDYAVRPRDKSGLGLVDIDGNVPGWIIIGRRGETATEFADRRRERSQRLNVRIHSYDWLLERAAARAEAIARRR